MATTVYTTEEISLQDGSKITLKRLNIKNQRVFMKEFEAMGVPGSNDEALDQLIDLAQICLEGIDKELSEDREKLEEVLDEPTIYKIIEVCSGLKLNDPNLLAVAVQALNEKETAGQN